MSKKYRTPQAPKTRNFVAKEMLDRKGPYAPKVFDDRAKEPYRKPKHKKKAFDDGFD
tara:strand:+ start:138 stop:308 length:171 start_codon:yes stop_codon:yes gene_type:complete